MGALFGIIGFMVMGVYGYGIACGISMYYFEDKGYHIIKEYIYTLHVRWIAPEFLDIYIREVYSF